MEQLGASGLTGEDSQYRCNWVLGIIQHTVVHVSGYPAAAPRQSVIALTLDRVVTDEVKKRRSCAMGETQSHLSLAEECPPGTKSRQDSGGSVSSSVGRWVLHAVKAFTSPHSGVSPRNWCWGNRI